LQPISKVDVQVSRMTRSQPNSPQYRVISNGGHRACSSGNESSSSARSS
jgi:hypothetical protein